MKKQVHLIGNCKLYNKLVWLFHKNIILLKKVLMILDKTKEKLLFRISKIL